MSNSHPLALPLVNIYAKGGYCVTFEIGSEKTPVNLIVDTGSSTLVVGQLAYKPENDTSLTATPYAQAVKYGLGGWDGPLVHTDVTISNNVFSITLEQCPLAIVSIMEQRKTFAQANGILGLAYRQLNPGYDLTEYLTEEGHDPAVTYPWPFAEPGSVCPHEHSEIQIAHEQKQEQSNNANAQVEAAQCDDAFSSNDLARFKAFLREQPEQDIIPYFTELETQGLCANKFAFYSQRSSIHHATDNPTTEQLKQDPLNQGWLILGGGKEQTQLYQGEFQHIKVEHDVHYNVTLLGIKVGDFDMIEAAPLKPQYDYFLTNAIVDTGVSGIMLTDVLFEGFKRNLAELKQQRQAAGLPVQDYLNLIAPFVDLTYQDVGIDASELDLTLWPDITFVFAGHSECDGTPHNDHHDDHHHDPDNPEPMMLTCKPHDYWQVNAPAKGKACFKIIGKLASWANQTLVGLPLLNNYYVIFDREEHGTGVIRFAEQKPPHGVLPQVEA
ncbi:A1 family peptidase [Shewanella sp. WXL01]|uniref:pepsin-like aspartic protease n=1 Tax=Shewanella sp. WXL01 TaxID=2709721 RepID=UPI0014386693|nr:pepsin-like aspartic protease [Shewanella sp. WXL01]NKF49864.1 A1 family peptidase [Shewanella sp. WXL01]